MTPDEAIKTALEAIDSLRDKVFPVESLKNAAAPFAFYERTEDDEDDALDGATGLLRAGFRVHFVARTYTELLLICGSGRTALRDLQGAQKTGLLIEQVSVRQASPDINEREVKWLRRIYAVELYYQKEE